MGLRDFITIFHVFFLFYFLFITSYFASRKHFFKRKLSWLKVCTCLLRTERMPGERPVSVFCVAIGISSRSFTGGVSPLAKAWKYLEGAWKSTNQKSFDMLSSMMCLSFIGGVSPLANAWKYLEGAWKSTSQKSFYMLSSMMCLSFIGEVSPLAKAWKYLKGAWKSWNQSEIILYAQFYDVPLIVSFIGRLSL